MGLDKASLEVDGEPMLARIVRVIAAATPRIWVAQGAPDRTLPELPVPVTTVADREPGQGPLGGLASAVAHIDASIELVFVTACDTPRITSATIARLVEHAREYDGAVPVLGDMTQPLTAIYRRTLLEHVPGAFARGARSMRTLLELGEIVRLTPEELGIDPDELVNVNAPEDLDRLRPS